MRQGSWPIYRHSRAKRFPFYKELRMMLAVKAKFSDGSKDFIVGIANG
jgi:hypothetical protein